MNSKSEKVNLIIGKNESMTDIQYHGDRTALSSSGLKMVLRDPNEFYRKYITGSLDEEKAHFSLGRYVHCQNLEPEKLSSEFKIYPGAVRRGKLYEKFVAENPGVTIITASEKETADKIFEAYQTHPIAKSITSDGIPEETYCAILDGLKVKVRVDYIADGYIADIKTTSGATDLDSIASTIIKWDYDLSAALYLDVVNAVSDKKVEDFIFLFTNKTNYEIIVCKASDELIENGRRKYKAAIAKYLRLQEANFFDPNKVPTKEIQIIELPSYGVYY